MVAEEIIETNSEFGPYYGVESDLVMPFGGFKDVLVTDMMVINWNYLWRLTTKFWFDKNYHEHVLLIRRCFAARKKHFKKEVKDGQVDQKCE